MRLGTKAETLEALAPVLTRSRVLPQVRLTFSEWGADPVSCLERIHSAFGGTELVVRSSALHEDSEETSMAGAYDSFLGVPGSDPEAQRRAVEGVFASYGAPAPGDQVLVQPRLSGVVLSGVLCTRELDTLAPYKVFSYDAETGSTDSVTSGAGESLRSFVRFRGCSDDAPTPQLAAVVDACDEIEACTGQDRLEIELAVDQGGDVWIFQVRPLTARVDRSMAESELEDAIDKARKKVEKLSRRHPHLLGTRSVFGVMPDWNPAEIIGLKPRALAVSLYKELVTDAIWAYQRDRYGYRDMRSFPLLVSFLGIPFVDVRVSFNSFVPKSLPDPIAEKLVNYYVDQLVESPHKHDKVEFEIVLSCFSPGVDQRAGQLADHGFNESEIGDVLGALRDVTRGILEPGDGWYVRDVARVRELERRRPLISDSEMSPIDKVYWLVEDAKRWGTLPFSGLARAAFIATECLRGLETVGALEPGDEQAFFRSLDSVTNRMQSALSGLATGSVSRKAFLEEFGHLRPGTYDILSKRYDEGFDGYFASLVGGGSAPSRGGRSFVLDDAKAKAVDEAIRKCDLGIDGPGFLRFAKEAIEAREWAKLAFTRNLSAALQHVEEIGATCDLDREQLAHLDIRSLLSLYSRVDAMDLKDILRRDIDRNREEYARTAAVQLPPLILEPSDVSQFIVSAEVPNYVTRERVLADVLREEDLEYTSPDGRIVCLRSADPGYDWIFAHRVAGLITMFGGANSHMAVRAAEQGVPAVIGAGRLAFERWSAAGRLEIDCNLRRVVVLR